MRKFKLQLLKIVLVLLFIGILYYNLNNKSAVSQQNKPKRPIKSNEEVAEKVEHQNEEQKILDVGHFENIIKKEEDNFEDNEKKEINEPKDIAVVFILVLFHYSLVLT